MAGWSDALQSAEQEMWDDIVQNHEVDSEAVAEAMIAQAVYDGGTVTSTYGAVEVNGITEEQKLFQQSATEVVDLADKRLARITRLRLVTDRDFPMWDLSYCYGTLKDGSAVRVRLPQSQFPKQGLNQSLVQMCKEVNVFGKGLGIFDPEVISKLYG